MKPEIPHTRAVDEAPLPPPIPPKMREVTRDDLVRVIGELRSRANRIESAAKQTMMLFAALLDETPEATKVAADTAYLRGLAVGFREAARASCTRCREARPFQKQDGEVWRHEGGDACGAQAVHEAALDVIGEAQEKQKRGE